MFDDFHGIFLGCSYKNLMERPKGKPLKTDHWDLFRPHWTVGSPRFLWDWRPRPPFFARNPKLGEDPLRLDAAIRNLGDFFMKTSSGISPMISG